MEQVLFTRENAETQRENGGEENWGADYSAGVDERDQRLKPIARVPRKRRTTPRRRGRGGVGDEEKMEKGE
jgi:hypothetical protein